MLRTLELGVANGFKTRTRRARVHRRACWLPDSLFMPYANVQNAALTTQCLRAAASKCRLVVGLMPHRRINRRRAPRATCWLTPAAQRDRGATHCAGSPGIAFVGRPVPHACPRRPVPRRGVRRPMPHERNRGSQTPTQFGTQSPWC